MKTSENLKRIVCVLPQGKALKLVHLLHEQKGVDNTNIHRGRGRSTTVAQTVSFGQYAEVEVVTLLVEEERAEEIFQFIFFEAEINRPHGGFLYQVPLAQSTEFKLPDSIKEEDG